MTVLAILAGLLLSWLHLEGLRRNSARFVKLAAHGGLAQARRVAMAFLFRWFGLAGLLVFCFHAFQANVLPFLSSLILSGIVLRIGYRKAYVG